LVEGLIPIEVGGVIFVLRGESTAATRVFERYDLRTTAVIPCTEGRTVAWIAGQDLRTEVLTPFVRDFKQEGAALVQQFVFLPVEGQTRLRQRCKDARACCDFGRLLCRFRDRNGKEDETCTRGVPKPPPEYCRE